jgi:hypothetical protein
MTEGLILDIDIEGDAITDLMAYPQLVSHELTVAMEKALQATERNVKDRTPVNIGNLRNSISHQIVSPFPNLVGSVGSPMAYSIVIEKGRKHGQGARMPPKWPIVYWLRRKLGLSLDEAIGAWYPVAKAIKEKGFSPEGDTGPEGARMFEEGLKATEPLINELFAAAIARSVQRYNES